jgi:hypothetical protein
MDTDTALLFVEKSPKLKRADICTPFSWYEFASRLEYKVANNIKIAALRSLNEITIRYRDTHHPVGYPKQLAISLIHTMPSLRKIKIFHSLHSCRGCPLEPYGWFYRFMNHVLLNYTRMGTYQPKRGPEISNLVVSSEELQLQQLFDDSGARGLT